MSTVAFIRRCLAAGMAFEAALIAAEAYEAEPPKQSKGAARTAKWRENKSSQTVTVTLGDASDAGDVSPPEVRPLSPQTPLTPTPTPPDITTRAREDAGFVKFWLAYPRKDAKAKARQAFTRAWKKLPPFDEEAILVGGLERAKAGWDDAQFIPHAATWLNGERWQDEATTVIPLNPRKAHERPHPYQPAPSGRAAKRGVWAEIIEQERRSGAGGPTGTG